MVSSDCIQEIPQDRKHFRLKVPSFDFTFSFSISLGLIFVFGMGQGSTFFPLENQWFQFHSLTSSALPHWLLRTLLSSVKCWALCHVLLVYLSILGWKPHSLNYQSFIKLLTGKQCPPFHSSSKLFWPFGAQIKSLAFPWVCLDQVQVIKWQNNKQKGEIKPKLALDKALAEYLAPK